MNKEELNQNIGMFLRVIRIKKKMTREAFADIFNKTEPTDVTTNEQSIGRYERGEVTIPGDKYEKFRWLNVTNPTDYMDKEG